MKTEDTYNGTFATTKKSEAIVWIVLGLIAIFCLSIGVSPKFYRYCFKRNLQQEVSVLEEMDKMRMGYEWSNMHPDRSISKNPYYTNKTVYELKTSIGDITNYNYGSEEEILAIKCKVAKETIEENKLYQKLELEEEKAEIKQDSLNDLALERLNGKTCK